MNQKIVRVLGKRGRITIPFELRMKLGVKYNDILSFEEKDNNTIIVRKEKLCEGCTSNCLNITDDASVERLIDSLTPNQQMKARKYLIMLWAGKENVTVNE